MQSRDVLTPFLNWVQHIGPWGTVLFGATYVPAALLFVPGSLLTLAAGFLFGLVKGTVIVSLGSTAGAAAAFLVGRNVAHQWVVRRLAGRPRLAAIRRAVETEGFKIVLLTRLSPLFPYNALNYAFGLTSVPVGRYILASWIGMLPGTIMYVYVGTAAKSLQAALSGDPHRSTGQQAMFALGLVATVAVTAIITRTARRALNEIIAEP
jgi:uncharacterized membrane protein YdjX (TVP38/TMEM64 family)